MFLENVIQLGWFGIPTNTSPSLFVELGIEWMAVQDGFWMKIISKLHWVSSIVLMTKLFFQMFYIMNFLVFLWMPLAIEPVFSEKTKVRVSLVVAWTVGAFEGMVLDTVCTWRWKSVKLAWTCTEYRNFMQWAWWCKLVGMTLASTYVLCLLWAVWLQFQRMVL